MSETTRPLPEFEITGFNPDTNARIAPFSIRARDLEDAASMARDALANAGIENARDYHLMVSTENDLG